MFKLAVDLMGSDLGSEELSKGVKEYLAQDPDAIDPKKYCAVGREEVKKYVMSKMHVVGSVNKA